MLNATQKDMIIALGETLESQFEETGNHVKRISQMMYRFCLLNNGTHPEAEMLKSASTMHDLGKVAIPDSILKKPGVLTDEEFEIIKTHTVYGYKILSKSNVNILQVAAEIAYYHHEKYDGSGYPTQMKGEQIPLYARMMAIVDVFDAMTHKRVYKEPYSVEETVDYI
jgi:response regulator RpfG family c-di-GMP phosphodiesterase